MSVRKKVVVSFNVEFTDECWKEFEEKDDEECTLESALDDIQQYLTSQVAHDNQPYDGYAMREPVVFWPEQFMEAVAEGEWKEEWEGEQP